MTEFTGLKDRKFDRTNAILAGVVFIIAFVVYALTVQKAMSFWDCGEFIACSNILGIPHPPGTPLFVLLGRVFALIPFVADIAYRINYISVLSSALTAMFSYLLTVKLIGYFFDDKANNPTDRIITYIGGVTGALFVAFGRTNWANSVEAEVYGLALALSVAIVWLTVEYFERRGTREASKFMILAFYLAFMGIGIHMTVFLVIPICALYFILKKSATPTDWLLMCSFVILELGLIMLFSDGRGGVSAFKLVSGALGLALLVKLYNKINWAIVIAIVSVSTVMMSFDLYMKIAPFALLAVIILGFMSKKQGWNLQWKTALAIIVIAFIGLSTHLYIPIRSEHNPRIDENNPSRDFRTFVNFLDRKQYGQVSMTDRMFKRRGSWANQLGRHPHMGFWSYFEEQYSSGGWGFLPFLALGLLGMIVAIFKRLEIGLPFFALFLATSVGLVLYMNFADGTMYNAYTGDAYLEVRNRDYFFTPAFVFFGIAMGMGVAAIIKFLRDKAASGGWASPKQVVLASTVFVLLPGFALAHNYHANDRSANDIPYQYATNLLDTCEENAILFTSGDNDTFPLWCVQEVYNYRRDVRVVNLSLLNTDWYTAQMKNRFGVPISLTDEQILWHPNDAAPSGQRPKKMFRDRPRRRNTYLEASGFGGRVVKVQDMMVDEIVLNSIESVDGDTWKLKTPIYFSSAPYAESPLDLRKRAVVTGLLYKLVEEIPTTLVDAEAGLDLYLNTYNFGGFENSDVYRDENATGVFIGVGINAIRIFDEFLKRGDTAKAEIILNKTIEIYPEYWQTYLLLADLHDKRGDSATADALFAQLHDTLTNFLARNPENLFYKQDLGLAKVEIGRRNNDAAKIEQGIALLSEAFDDNSNSNYAFRKLITVLSQQGRYTDIQDAAYQFAEYKVNLNDPMLKQILRLDQAPGGVPPGLR